MIDNFECLCYLRRAAKQARLLGLALVEFGCCAFLLGGMMPPAALLLKSKMLLQILDGDAVKMYGISEMQEWRGGRVFEGYVIRGRNFSRDLLWHWAW